MRFAPFIIGNRHKPQNSTIRRPQDDAQGYVKRLLFLDLTLCRYARI